MLTLVSFKNWLHQNEYSPSTVRNYLLDTSKYLQYLGKNSEIEAEFSEIDLPIIFSIDNLSAYISQFSSNSNHQRYLASLNVFCQYATDQNLISTNPIIKIRKIAKRSNNPSPTAELRKHRSEFALHLAKHNHSPITIKNYINDIDQYINWLETNPLGSQ